MDFLDKKDCSNFKNSLFNKSFSFSNTFESLDKLYSRDNFNELDNNTSLHCKEQDIFKSNNKSKKIDQIHKSKKFDYIDNSLNFKTIKQFQKLNKSKNSFKFKKTPKNKNYPKINESGKFLKSGKLDFAFKLDKIKPPVKMNIFKQITFLDKNEHSIKPTKIYYPQKLDNKIKSRLKIENKKENSINYSEKLDNKKENSPILDNIIENQSRSDNIIQNSLNFNNIIENSPNLDNIIENKSKSGNKIENLIRLIKLNDSLKIDKTNKKRKKLNLKNHIKLLNRIEESLISNDFSENNLIKNDIKEKIKLSSKVIKERKKSNFNFLLKRVKNYWKYNIPLKQKILIIIKKDNSKNIQEFLDLSQKQK